MRLFRLPHSGLARVVHDINVVLERGLCMISPVCSPSLPATRGRGAFRIDYDPIVRAFTVYSGNSPDGPWHSTTQTIALDAMPNPPYVISNFVVGLVGRQFNPASVS